jgi:hypothetical protein
LKLMTCNGEFVLAAFILEFNRVIRNVLRLYCAKIFVVRPGCISGGIRAFTILPNIGYSKDSTKANRANKKGLAARISPGTIRAPPIH